MEVKSIGYIFGVIFAILVAVFLVGVIYRRYRGKQKIRHMPDEEKWQLLSSLTEPFGFVYEPLEDIFVSHRDAWQREHGYMALFDRLAPKFNMIFDAYPVYFDYQEKTWLIEFWKGQYGINTGAEVGVYHANRRIPKEQRKFVQYNAVSDEEMPIIGISLEKNWQKLFSYKKYHWWLAAFRMGMFSQPKNLEMYVYITFDDMQAVEAFCQGLEEAGFAKEQYRIHGYRVSILLDSFQKHKGLEKWHRSIVQGINKCFCGLYKFTTRPFTKTADRMLFLYEQLPWCFKHMLRLHAFGRKHK